MVISPRSLHSDHFQPKQTFISEVTAIGKIELFVQILKNYRDPYLLITGCIGPETTLNEEISPNKVNCWVIYRYRSKLKKFRKFANPPENPPKITPKIKF